MKKIVVIILLASGFTMSCNKILVQNPESSLNATIAFTSPSAITAGMLGVYNSFTGASYYGTAFTIFVDMEADNLNHTGSFPTYTEISNRGINPNNTDVTNTWNAIYAGINRANNIIASAKKLTDPAFNQAAALGEAQFLRAYMYFDLMRFWGGSPAGYADPAGVGVPLILTPTYVAADATPKARSTAAQVFSQILNDLNYAIANIPATNSAGRANTIAAMALKARVLLYDNQFDSAAIVAQQVITAATAHGSLAPSYASLYTVKNQQPESIFELNFSATNTNGIYFYYYGRDEVASSQSLQAAIEANDTRGPVVFFMTKDAGGKKVNGTQKYVLADGSNDITLIRLAEMYLIHAEGVIRGSNPNIVTAQNDINVIRTRAGLANTTAATIPALQAAILQENRIEFAHEAHRWFDLRRLGLAASTLNIQDPTKVLWPIPQNEVLTSGNVITQNPGY